MFKKSRSVPVVLLAALLFVALSTCKKNPVVPNTEILTKPVIWLNTFELTFAAFKAGVNPAQQPIMIKNSGKSTLSYTISTDAEWLSVAEVSGSSTDQMNEHMVKVDKSNLDPRDEAYTGIVTVQSDDAYNNPQKIAVSFMLSKEPPPKIGVTPKNLKFSTQVGSNPADQEIFVQNTGSGTLRFQAVPDSTWIQVDPVSANVVTGQRKVTVSLKSKSLAAGTYSGQIQIKDPAADNSPQTVNVNLTVTQEKPPTIAARPNTLAFQTLVGGNPPSQSLYVGNSGEGTLNYTVAGDATWLIVSPVSGSTKNVERRHTVSVISSSLGTGTYRGTIIIQDPNASNTPKAVAVTLNVTAPLTDNKIGISLSPSSGGINTVVTIPISIRGNTSPIEVFGLRMHYNTTRFQFLGVSSGTLTGSWAAVDGNAVSGTITIGGFLGSGTRIPTGSLGSIAVVTLRVIAGPSSQITIDSLTDDVVGMILAPGAVTFTFL